MKFGKWLGAGLGWTFGGPIGGILGFAFGSLFDSYSEIKDREANGDPPLSATDFEIALLILSAAVIKADGRIERSELEYVRQYLIKQFGPAFIDEKMEFLRRVIEKEYSIRQVCLQVRSFTLHPARLHIVQILFGISTADGHMHRAEEEMIRLIAGYLGVSSRDYISIKAMFEKQYQRNTYSSSSGNRNSSSYNYKILGVLESASETEIKKAYRNMAMKHHPDKVGHLGESHRKTAEVKFREIQEAYESIKMQRGIK